MSAEMIGVAAALLMVVLIGLRTPIAVALTVSGFVGYAGYEGLYRATTMIGLIPGEMLRGYSLSVLPLFVFMGAIASRAGLSASLYEATRAMSGGNARGSLASATIGACAMFGSICGSSIATVATMTPIAMPEMQRFGYSDRLAAGAVAAGGTIGILIPPSIILVIYALLVEASVPALFAAGFILGILLTVFCILVVKVLVWFKPSLSGPPAPAASLSARLRAVAGTWKIALIFGVSLGGIYLGWFSPTEAAAVGAGLALAVALGFRTLGWQGFVEAVEETVHTSAMLFFIFMGALAFGRFVALSRVPVTIVDLVTGWQLAPVLVILMIVLVYVLLGCFLDTVAMILITAPIMLPLVESVGYDQIWFGILVVVVAEMGLITPPVGMNIFVIRAQVPTIPLIEIIRGVAPFLAAHLALVALLIAVPGVATWLPSLLTK